MSAISSSMLGQLARRLGLGRRLGTVRRRALEALLPDHVILTVGREKVEFTVTNEFEYAQFERVRTDPDGTVLAEFERQIRPDDVLWDVGANVGVFSCFGAANGLGVVSVDPSPANVERVRENLDRNGLDASVLRYALSDHDGRSQLRTSIGPPGGPGAFGYIEDGAPEDTFSVPVTTGTTLAAHEGLPLPTVLKVDVEGEELAVLRGFGDALSDCRLVYCNVYEKHFEDGSEGAAIEALLEDHGLSVTHVGDWQGGYFVRGERGCR